MPSRGQELRIFLMRKTAIFLLSLILVSCASTGTYYSPEEKSASLERLSEDMLLYISSDYSIPAETIVSYLPSAYTTYSLYVPLYGRTALSYASAISDIVSPLVPSVYSVLRERMRASASEASDSSISSDTGFTDAVRLSSYAEIVQLYRNELKDEDDALSVAYRPSLDEFSSIRKAYMNLTKVGHTVYIPQPVPIDDEALSRMMADYLFTVLSEAEKMLKNQPPENADSPYNIFWRQK